jgi:hypothetical protein
MKQTKQKDTELEFILVKLVVCMQTTLELFDEFKGTKIYRHDIKSGINNLSKKLEDHLGMVYHHIDGDQEKEEAFMAIQRAVQQMVATPIEEMYAMGEIVS